MNKCFSHTINSMPWLIRKTHSYIHVHSLQCVSKYAKHAFIENYNETRDIQNWYVKEIKYYKTSSCEGPYCWCPLLSIIYINWNLGTSFSLSNPRITIPSYLELMSAGIYTHIVTRYVACVVQWSSKTTIGDSNLCS